ncbi:translocation/assembly module TamB domain-containing protein [Rhodopila sp.]|uniref:translocation/assembly module TamB domain-containing protein n=1 Tax=Rhodopila sp. TaxID=2480087 RepID=UPI002B8CCFFA|nr:translocation/assembly module TamB domain-containing protein [Rhodopila sp.]HVZ07080.1 translocation/assembly module TamB domain-containing protein [Rhodopila sp.]
MRRLLTWLGWTVAVLIALPVVAVIAVLILANTGTGRALIESQAATLTGGMVRLQGIGGRFPDRLRIGTIEVADAKGVYATIHDAALDWSPLRLARMTVAIDQLTAREIDLPRLPESSGAKSGSGGSSSSYRLPVRVELDRLRVDSAVIGAAVAGVAARLSLDGEGRADSLTDATVRLVAKRLDSLGEYRVSAALTGDHIKADLQAEEPPHGLISGIAKLPDLGAVSVEASIDGSRDALATQAGVKAGDLSASASGTVDLDHAAADLLVKAQAPAMTPAPGVSWQSVLVDARVHGPFTSPDVAGTVRLRDMAAGGARITALDADVSGNAGQVSLRASAAVAEVPGPKPDLLAAAPVRLEATVELAEPDRPVRFTVTHPLLALDGIAQTAGSRNARVHLVVGDLAPLAAVGAVDLRGSADLTAQAALKGDTTTLALQGKIGITGGLAPVPPLVGPAATIDMAASLRGQDVTLSHLAVNGKTLRITASGSLASQALDADWTLALTDLAAVQPGVSGKVEAKGHAGGKLTDLAATADIVADVAARGYSSGRVTTHVEASGLPEAPKASVTAQGTLLDAPLSLAVTGDRTGDGTVHATIDHVTWKSLKAGGALTLPTGAMLPLGNLRLTMTRLADLSPLVGRPLNGDATATLDSDERAARANVTVRGLGVAGAANAGRIVLAGTVTDPLKNPAIDATMTADGVSATSVQGTTARVTVKGTLDALAVGVTANATAAGAPTRLTTAATVNADARTVLLRSLEASWKQQTLRLLGPATIAFKDGVSVDRLRLGFRQAVLTLAGSAGTRLDLTATLRDLPADIGTIIDPSYAADGVINAEARLTGTPARPEGSVKLTADRVRQRRGPGQALPPASLNLNATLLGTSVRLDGRLTAGSSNLTASGTAPMAASGPLDLRTEGRVDLRMLDPLLMAEGRRARGTIALNATVAGTAVAPRINGTVTLTGGAFTDYRLNARVTDLNATIQANGDTITLSQFAGRAGEGTLGGSGTISLAGAMPVDLHFTASNARPIAGDLLSAVLNADVTVRGDVKARLEAGGTVTIMRADIRIPETLPASVAVLPVRDPNAPPPPPPPPPSDSVIALNITVNAPEQVFIRGRGLNAELGGHIHVGGTAANPQPSGALTLRRGTLSIIGTTLTFTEGQIDYNGGDLTNPALKFVAQSVTSTLVATLTITGDVQHLKIALSSVPDMPQDEILAQMLFNTDSSKLSPLQLAQIAAALAQLSGATSGIGDPLDAIRSSLGLDRLTVGSDSSGKPTLEAGRYISRRVYVGARQSASGGGSQATLQVDLTRGLKLEATAGSGQTTATGATSSSDAATVGLRYQFEY